MRNIIELELLMANLDLVLLHAPSVYDFRDRPTIYGPISDVIPSTPIFEMYPLGFVSMLGYLEFHGFKVRIINLAVKMLKNPNFEVESFISKLDTNSFGIDLHWLAHAAGSLDIAGIIKKYHSKKPVILGGLSASYYHREIIQHFPQIDYILRGDTTEKPLLELIHRIEKDEEPVDVENLTWRDRRGKKWINPLTFVPENIDGLGINYTEMVEHVIRHRDLVSALPFADFWEYPFTALLTCKGCSYNCITCGGSNSAFQRVFNRDRPVFKSPEVLLEEMKIISDYFKAPLFLIGDLRQGGRKWVDEVLNGIRYESFDNTITFELFDAAPESYIKKLANSTESWTLEISPESHDDSVRTLMGKPYTIKEMEKTIENALDNRVKKLDVYFMVGLAGQTRESVLDTVRYSRKLYQKIKISEKLHIFIAPMAPFLDPGSLVFENPTNYGFIQLYKNLREHKNALYQPSWKLYLSYYTDWMSRDEITEITYDAMIRMNKLKAEMGIINQGQKEKTIFGLNTARQIVNRIDQILESTTDESDRNLLFKELQSEVNEAQRTMEYAKKELRMPGLSGIRLTGVLKYLLNRFKFL